MNTDHHYRRAVSYHQRNRGTTWLECYHCAKVVGTNGQTAQLAADMRLSPDAVEDRAHAYWLFASIFRDVSAKEAGRLRHILGYSFFNAVWEYHLTPSDAYEWLRVAVEENVHIRGLRQQLSDALGKDDPRARLLKKLKILLSTALETMGWFSNDFVSTAQELLGIIESEE